MEEVFEDELEYTFCGSEKNLDNFMEKLRTYAKQLADECNVEIE